MGQKIIIYGGAFNPPTVAHGAILSKLCSLARKEKAQIWLLPSGQRQDKTIKTAVSERISYLRACIADTDTYGVTVQVKVTELVRQKPTETIDTVREFERKFPSNNFIWVFGTDSIHTMHSWRDGRYLLEKLEKIVVTRPGYELSVLPPASRLLRVVTPEISSTLVRSNIYEGKPYDQLVSPRVAKVIAATMKS